MQVSGLSGAAGGLYQFGATTSRSTELQVTTAEGDRLTMSTSSIRTVGAVGLAAAAGASSVTGAALQASGSNQVTLSVEGNISQEELRDLVKVIKAFERASAKGDARRLLHRLSRPDLDTIATVSGSARTETTVLTARASILQLCPPPSRPATGPANPPETLSEPDAAPEPAAG